MEEKYVSWEVHHEFERRMTEENNRQNHRISALEETVKEIADLAASVKVLAANMERMAKEQEKQGARLEAIESKPAERWESVIKAILTGVVGAIIGGVLAGVVL